MGEKILFQKKKEDTIAIVVNICLVPNRQKTTPKNYSLTCIKRLPFRQRRSGILIQVTCSKD
jgi:hypothetical protein